MWRLVPMAVVCALTGTAHADYTVLLARSDSNVDWGTRKRVETAVLALAKKVDRGAAQTDSGFADLALAAGCSGNVAKCKTAVLDAIDIDELVVITIEKAGEGKASITVRRASKRADVRAASAVVVMDDDGDAAVRVAFASLFGVSAKAAAAKPPAPRPEPSPPADRSRPEPSRTASATVRTETAAIEVEPARPAPGTPEPASSDAVRPEPEPEPQPEPARAVPPPTEVAAMGTEPGEPGEATVTAAPDGAVVDQPEPSRYRKLYIGGLIGGGALAIVGVMLWREAASIEDELADAPDRTSADIEHLLDLQASGDRYALWGNVTFIGGIAIAGASGFLLWRDVRRGRSSTARVAPAMFDHGAGVTLTFGATP